MAYKHDRWSLFSSTSSLTSLLDCRLFASITNDVDFTRARQGGWSRPLRDSLRAEDIDCTRARQGVEPNAPRFTSWSIHRLHTSTSRGGADRALRDSLRARDIDFTQARQGEEQRAISKILVVVLNSIDASHLFDAPHHYPSSSTTAFC